MALLKGEGTHQILYGGADIFSGLRHLRGYLARPDHAGSFPGILLIHGSDALTSSVKSVARRLARNGLAVVGPDLNGGGRPRVMSNLVDTFQWMSSAHTPWVRPGSIGVVALGPAAEAAVRFAGEHDVSGMALISPVFDGAIPASSVPLLGFYGKEDELVPADKRQAAQQDLAHGEWILYGGVGHGLVDESTEDYRWEVAEDVIDRMVEFFGAREP